MSRVVGAVLAAGAGVRMGTPKGELVVAGERLLDRAVRALAAGGCAEVIAVTRAGVGAEGARCVPNPRPERGMRSSLELAVDAVPDGADALVVVLVDMPGVGEAAVRAVLGAWRPGRIVQARYGAQEAAGRRGHPTVMSPALWRAALAVAGPDEGARAFMRAHPDLVDAIDVPGDPTDLDTPDELARWRGRALS